MQLHNTSKRKVWRKVKGELTSQFGTITAVAQKLKCHRNAIRLAVEGKAPNVLDRLKSLRNPDSKSSEVKP